MKRIILAICTLGLSEFVRFCVAIMRWSFNVRERAINDFVEGKISSARLLTLAGVLGVAEASRRLAERT